MSVKDINCLLPWIRINKFFEVDFAMKVNASNERRFDRSTVIFKFGVRIKLHVCKYSRSAKNMYIQTIDNKNKRLKVAKK